MYPFIIVGPVTQFNNKGVKSFVDSIILVATISFLWLTQTSTLSYPTISASTLHTLLANPEYRSILDPPIVMPKLLIYGCGTLGTAISNQLLMRNDFSRMTITGITKSYYHHDFIRHELGETSRLQLWTSEEYVNNFLQNNMSKFPNIIFCAPPSTFKNYVDVIQMCMDQLWSGSHYGKFVFTSSGGIYGNTNEVVTENSRTVNNQTTTRNRARNLKHLLEGEKIVLNNNGTVLRLAELYNLMKGPHTYWFSKGKINGKMGKFLNMLHYEDAASVCLKVISSKNNIVQKKVFLVSDGNPVSRREICESTKEVQLFSKLSMPVFEYECNDIEMNGKVYNGSWSNHVLGWRPVYDSFTKFMEDIRKKEKKKLRKCFK